MTGWLDARVADRRPGILAAMLGALRVGALGAVLAVGLAVHLAVRSGERLACGRRRPVTARITQGVCRVSLAILRIRLAQRGRPAREGAAVANHVSWLDILVLGACDRVTFVAKAEVAGWPGIGWLARATGTVFIARRAVEAGTQRRLLEDLLAAGERLLFFPEGTSTDGLRVLPFKSSLFAAFFAEALRGTVGVRPVSVRYAPPPGCDPRFYGWWGDMALGPHLWRIACARDGGGVVVTWHQPIPVRDHADRKSLAAACERSVRVGHGAAAG